MGLKGVKGSKSYTALCYHKAAHYPKSIFMLLRKKEGVAKRHTAPATQTDSPSRTRVFIIISAVLKYLSITVAQF